MTIEKASPNSHGPESSAAIRERIERVVEPGFPYLADYVLNGGEPPYQSILAEARSLIDLIGGCDAPDALPADAVRDVAYLAGRVLRQGEAMADFERELVARGVTPIR